MRGSLKALFISSFCIVNAPAPALADGRSASGEAKNGKDKFISAQADLPSASKNFNFSEVDISGAAKKPQMDMVSLSTDSRGYGFVKVRLNWNNEMIDTATNLDR